MKKILLVGRDFPFGQTDRHEEANTRSFQFWDHLSITQWGRELDTSLTG